MKDIARIDLGAQTYNIKGRLNGQPAAIRRVLPTAGHATRSKLRKVCAN